MGPLKKSLPLLIVGSYVLAGCATTPVGEEKGGDDIAARECFNVRDVRSLSAVTDRFVLAHCVRSGHFLLTMEPACLGLEDSSRFMVSNEFNRVCSNFGATLTYRYFDQTRSCRILNVEAVEGREAAQEIVARRSGSEVPPER